MRQRFKDRVEAGQELAKSLTAFAGKEDTLILGLPRGGVPVACEVAKALSLPMDVWLVRKLGMPGHAELAMGAIAVGGVCYVNQGLVRSLGIPKADVERVIEMEIEELARRNNLYRVGQRPPNVEGKTVIVVDDGLATGSTMRAAVLSLQKANVGKILVAVPVGAASTCDELELDHIEVVCLYKPEPFVSVGQWFEDFSQVSDEKVQELLGEQIEA